MTQRHVRTTNCKSIRGNGERLNFRLEDCIRRWNLVRRETPVAARFLTA
jgi:hypothetical protein